MTCIEHTQKGRYAYTKVNQVMVGKHVLVLMAKTGEVADGRVARHSCDNTRCLTPEHLSWGTHADNTSDMVDRGRHRKVQATLRKISDDDVRRIRVSPEGNKALGRQLSVNATTIRSIRRGLTYKGIL